MDEEFCEYLLQAPQKKKLLQNVRNGGDQFDPSNEKPSNLAEIVDCEEDGEIVRLIIDKYKDHPSVVAINQDQAFEVFTFQEVDSQEVRSLLDSMDGKKSHTY